MKHVVAGSAIVLIPALSAAIAKVLGLEIPPTLLDRADEVIA